MEAVVEKTQSVNPVRTASSEPIVFKIVTTERDKQKVYRFRYDVYVEEMNRKQKWANHVTKTIQEPLDRTAIILAAFQGNEVVGTCRMNFSNDTEFEYADLYEFDRFESLYPGRVAFFSKLMIKPELRKGMLFMKFMREIYKIMRIEDMEVSLLDCNDHLIKSFTKVGYRQYKESFQHPEYGWVTPMVVYHRDEEHFKKMNSPVYELCRHFNRTERLPKFEINLPKLQLPIPQMASI